MLARSRVQLDRSHVHLLIFIVFSRRNGRLVTHEIVTETTFVVVKHLCVSRYELIKVSISISSCNLISE